MAKVDFFANRDDLRTAMLGALGFSTRYIAAQTKLTTCQIQYRLNKAAIRRLDYRNGDSDVAHLVFKQVQSQVYERIKPKLQRAQQARRPRLRVAS